jgi:MFS family permease
MAGLVTPGPGEAADPAEISSLTAYRPFALFWLSRVAAVAALQMQAVAVGWQMYALTGSALDLGLVGLAQFTPSVLFMLIAGHAADRYDRRLVLRLAQIVEGTATAALAYGTFTGSLTREAIFALVFLIGLGRAFEAPAVLTFLAILVPPGLLSRAIAGSSSATQVATITGPAIGGLLYALSPTLTYALCTTLFFSSVALLSFVKAGYSPPERKPPDLATLFIGITFVRRNPLILGAISLDMFAVLLGGATALLPIFARDILETGPWGLGILRAAPAVGALVMAVMLARLSFGRHAGRKMFLAVAIFGIATLVFGLSTSFPLSLAALAVLGAADVVNVVVRQTIVQMQTPDEMRGRVTAVNTLFIGTSNQLGEFESGVVAALVGAVPAVVIGGVGTLLIVALWMKLFPELLNVDRIEGPRQ